MARAAAIHAVVTSDINEFPIVALATVKHELVTALSRVERLEDKPWHYVRVTDVGYHLHSLQEIDPAGAPTAFEFYQKEK